MYKSYRVVVIVSPVRLVTRLVRPSFNTILRYENAMKVVPTIRERLTCKNRKECTLCSICFW